MNKCIICNIFSQVSISNSYEDHICIYLMILGASASNKSVLCKITKDLLLLVEDKINALLQENGFNFPISMLWDGTASFTKCMIELSKRGGRMLYLSDEVGGLAKLLDLINSSVYFLCKFQISFLLFFC